MTTFSASRRSWTHVLAVALAALLALGVTGGLAVGASAHDATAAKAKAKPKARAKAKTKAKAKAKAKAKKCKKGYKKVGKTCKKKAPKKKPAPAKTSATVQSISLTRVVPRVYGVQVYGTITLKQPVTSLKVTVVRSRAGRDTIREDTIEGDGTSLTVDFEVVARRPIIREPSNAPITYWVVADGVKSNVLR